MQVGGSLGLLIQEGSLTSFPSRPTCNIFAALEWSWAWKLHQSRMNRASFSSKKIWFNMYVLSHKYLLNKLLMPKDSHLRGSAKGDRSLSNALSASVHLWENKRPLRKLLKRRCKPQNNWKQTVPISSPTQNVFCELAPEPEGEGGLTTLLSGGWKLERGLNCQWTLHCDFILKWLHLCHLLMAWLEH